MNRRIALSITFIGLNLMACCCGGFGNQKAAPGVKVVGGGEKNGAKFTIESKMTNDGFRTIDLVFSGDPKSPEFVDETLRSSIDKAVAEDGSKYILATAFVGDTVMNRNQYSGLLFYCTFRQNLKNRQAGYVCKQRRNFGAGPGNAGSRKTVIFDDQLDPYGVAKRRQRKSMSLEGLTDRNFRRQCRRTQLTDNSDAKMDPSRIRRSTLVQVRVFQDGVAQVTQGFSGSFGSSDLGNYDFVGKCSLLQSQRQKDSHRR